MNIPIKVIRRFARQETMVMVGIVVALVSLILAVSALWSQVDGDTFGDLASEAKARPTPVAVGIGGFGFAFLIRSSVWTKVLTGVSFGQSAAAIHLALGANHVLPFRLGEPLRVVSVVRRTSVDVTAATTSTIVLRSSDIASLFLLGIALGPSLMARTLFPESGRRWSIALLLLACAGLVALLRLAHQRGIAVRDHLPSLPLFLAIGSAWLFEAVLVWQIASLTGASLSYPDAVLVTCVAVAAQLVAIAPGGLGTYEAAATAALVLTGVDTKTALAIAISTHLLKTLYSLITGAIAMILPRPGLIGRLRVPKTIEPATFTAPGDGPIVLFMPAYQEGPRIAAALERTPTSCRGRKIINLVIDDGSTDDTVAKAKGAGAVVHSFEYNSGLGAAVADGLQRSVQQFGASVVVFCDADGEYDPADIEDLVAPILDGKADYVIGSRFAGDIEHMRPHRRFGNLTLTKWVQWMSRTPVSDGQSGYRALSAQAATASEMAHDYNYAQVLTLDLIQKGFRYHEVPITYHFRESGDSFVKLGTYLRAVVPAIWRVLNPAATSEEIVGEEVLVLDDVGGEGTLQDIPAGAIPHVVAPKAGDSA